jgi:hypothetical protein
MSFNKFYKRKYESTAPEEAVQEPQPTTVEESAPAPEPKDVSKMSKAELDKYAESIGIKLDGRKSLSKMLKDFAKATSA